MGKESRKTFTVEYSCEDLRRMILRPIMCVPVNFYQGLPIHLVKINEDLPGEFFKTGEYEQMEIEASNYGRIRKNKKVLEQAKQDNHNYDYLLVKGLELSSYPIVHRLIATIWCKKPSDYEFKDLQVHHINNNGYDNRPCNLLWVTKDEHESIEQGIFIKTAKEDFDTYKYI